MEEEEREAQSAKLQELIRRGTPADLQEANHLMKIMAGYDQSSKTDYRAKAAQDIGKLRKKAALLEDMLAKVQPGETIGQQDTFEVRILRRLCLHAMSYRNIGTCKRAEDCPTKDSENG